jgi:small-conductance mechanosensitive channel/CRP-like cAMP-binding protein
LEAGRLLPFEMTTQRLLRLLAPTALLAIFLIPILQWSRIAPALDALSPSTVEFIGNALRACAWLAGAWTLVRITELLLWDAIVAPRLGGQVPRLLKDVTATIIFLLAIGGFIGLTLGLPVTGLWATSGVLGLVVGFAVLSMIADVFSGIAINVDRPFTIGDWIRVHPRGTDLLIGCVEEVSWRATRIRDADHIVHVIPNSLLGSMVVTNLSLPETTSRFDLSFRLDFEVPAERALRVLKAGVTGAESVLADPKPSVRIEELGDRGIEYVVRYWIDTAQYSPPNGRHLVCSSVLAHLNAAGIGLAHTQRDLYIGPLREPALDLANDRPALVKRTALFQSLTTEEAQDLAASMTERRFRAGDVVFNQHDAGDSMFLVVEGLLFVLSPDDGHGEPLRVGQVAAGQFFGEMSLLTGEPRSATISAALDCVTYEIKKADLSVLLERRPEVALDIASVVAERQARNLETCQRANRDAQRVEVTNLAEQLFKKMTEFFGGRNRRTS